MDKIEKLASITTSEFIKASIPKDIIVEIYKVVGNNRRQWTVPTKRDIPRPSSQRTESGDAHMYHNWSESTCQRLTSSIFHLPSYILHRITLTSYIELLFLLTSYILHRGAAFATIDYCWLLLFVKQVPVPPFPWSPYLLTDKISSSLTDSHLPSVARQFIN